MGAQLRSIQNGSIVQQTFNEPAVQRPALQDVITRQEEPLPFPPHCKNAGVALKETAKGSLSHCCQKSGACGAR
jgi:hypothetical protein